MGVPQDRRRGRRAAVVRHGALLGARRGGTAPEPDGRLRRRHLDDAQDARRAAGGIHPLPRGARIGDRPRRVPGAPGRAARARDRREGDVLPDRRLRCVPRLPDAGAGERRRARRRDHRRRARRAHRRHRHASAAARSAPHGVDGQGRRGAAARRQADDEPQHGAVRRAAADRRLRRADRDPGGDDARVRRGRLPRGRQDHRRRARRGRRRLGARGTERGALRAAAALSRLPRLHEVRRRDRARSSRSTIRSSGTSSACCATSRRRRRCSVSSSTS